MIEPDFFANIRLLSTEAGGRQGPTPEDFYGCPLSFGQNNGEGRGRFFDCRILLEKNSPLFPGDEREVPVKMLSREEAQPHLRIGQEFQLWEGRFIGQGVITRIAS